MAERAVVSEKMGKHGATDLLAVSFSSNDYVGHRYGPDSPEAHETAVPTDQIFDNFFGCVGPNVRMQNVLVVLTADHAAAPTPGMSIDPRRGGGRYPGTTMAPA